MRRLRRLIADNDGLEPGDEEELAEIKSALDTIAATVTAVALRVNEMMEKIRDARNP